VREWLKKTLFLVSYEKFIITRRELKSLEEINMHIKLCINAQFYVHISGGS
jgi:hypothetical protein